MDKIRESIRGKRKPRHPDPERSDVFAIMPPETLGTLPEDVLLKMPPEKFDAMTSENLARLPQSVIIRNLSRANLERLPQSVLAKLPPRTLQGLSATTLQYLPPDTLMKLPPSTLAALPPSCLSQLPSDTLRTLPRETLLMLPHSITRPIFQNESPAGPPGSQAPPGYYQPDSTRRGPMMQQDQAPRRFPSMARLPNPNQATFSGPQPSVPGIPETLHQRLAERERPADPRRVSDPQPRRPPSSGRLATLMRSGTTRDPDSRRGSQDSNRTQEPPVAPSGAMSAAAAAVSRGQQPTYGAVVNIASPSAERASWNAEHQILLERARQTTDEMQEMNRAFQNELAVVNQKLAEEKHRKSALEQQAAHMHNHLQQARYQLDEERKTSDSRLKEVTEKTREVEALQQALASTRSEMAANHAENDKATTRLREQAQGSSYLMEKNRLLESKFDDLINKTSWAERDHQDQMERAKNDYQAKIQSLEDEHKNTITKLREQLRGSSYLLEKNRMLESKLDEIIKKTAGNESDSRREMDSIRVEHQARIQSLEGELEDFKTKHLAELENLRNAHRNELLKVEAESEDRFDSARAQHAAAMAEKQQEHETQVQQLKQKVDDLEKAIGDERIDHDKKVRDMSDDFKNHIERARPGQEALKKEFEKQRAQLQKATSDLQRATSNLQKATSDHEKEIEDQRAELEEVTAEHQRELDAQRAQHDMAMAQLNQRMTAELDRYKDRLRQEREEHRRALAVQRVDNADSAFQPAEADLQRKFAELKLAVQVVTEPFNLGRVRSLRGGRLDPTRFLEREAEEQGAMRYLLQSAVWARVMDGFFSAPCGFGTLGSGDGRRMLTDLYRAWLRLFTPRGGESGGKFWSFGLIWKTSRGWTLG